MLPETAESESDGGGEVRVLRRGEKINASVGGRLDLRQIGVSLARGRGTLLLGAAVLGSPVSSTVCRSLPQLLV